MSPISGKLTMRNAFHAEVILPDFFEYTVSRGSERWLFPAGEDQSCTLTINIDFGDVVHRILSPEAWLPDLWVKPQNIPVIIHAR